MRKLRLMAVLLTLVLLVSVAQAQDFIILSDGSSIPAKVLEITQTELKYKKASNPDGPTYTLAVQSIDYVRFENGTTETFGKQQRVSALDTFISNQAGLKPFNTEQSISDTELMQIGGYQKHEKKASLYKIIAWTGFGVCIVAGICVGQSFDDSAYKTLGIVGGAAAGAIWCTSFLIASHNQKKKAEEARYMFGSLMQIPVFDANGKQLSASVDMFRDRLNDNTSLAFGLKFTF